MSDFTAADVGARFLRMSTKEILDGSGRNVNAISRAWYAFDHLYESPLAFDRRAKAEDTNYNQIKSSCATLERDFNDDRKCELTLRTNLPFETAAHVLP